MAIARISHTIDSEKGVALSVDRYTGAGRDTAIVICPGFFQSKDTKTFQGLSRALAADWDVIAMDFRGHGRSSGLFTFSAKETTDLEAVLRWTKEKYRNIAVMGFSLGGAAAINTLAKQPQTAKTVIAVSAPALFEDIEFKFWTPEAMRTGLQGLEAGSGCRPGNLWLKKERPVERVAHLAPIPVLFIHGTRDVIVGVEHSRRLHAAAAAPKRIEMIEGGSHAEALFRDEPERFSQLVGAWFAQTLPPILRGCGS